MVREGTVMLRIHAYDVDRLVPVASDLPARVNAEIAADLAVQTAPAATTPAVVWYDLVSPTAEEERDVGSRLGIVVPTMDEMEDIELSARLYQEDGAEFMTMTVLTRPDSGTPRK